MDASTIDLCLSVFPWAKFRQTKGAVKLHAVLDHDGLIPAFIDITDGKTHDVTQGRRFKLPKDSILTMDRGYIDYAWLQELDSQGVFFVTRCKSNMRYSVIKRHKVVKGSGITSDQLVILSSQRGQNYGTRIRRVGYKDLETGKQYYYLTNHFRLSAGPLRRFISNVGRLNCSSNGRMHWINLPNESFSCCS